MVMRILALYWLFTFPTYTLDELLSISIITDFFNVIISATLKCNAYNDNCSGNSLKMRYIRTEGTQGLKYAYLHDQNT